VHGVMDGELISVEESGQGQTVKIEGGMVEDLVLL
jgi:hypothetical protein